MEKRKNKILLDSMVVGFALFSMFFGAGNVVFPPFLGFGSGQQWANGFIFYFIADIGLAMLALFALIKAGGAENVTGRIGTVASDILMCAIILCIGPMVAIPRTAATTYEMSIAPLISGISPVLFSIFFFIVVLLLSIKQSAVIDIVGKVLTPALLIGLLVLIIKGAIDPIGPITNMRVSASYVTKNGIMSGYQTMDVLAALAFGVLIIKSANDKGYTEQKSSSKMIAIAAAISAILLFIVYFGLTYLGATAGTVFNRDIGRADLVISIVKWILGDVGLVLFAIVVALACLTTAVALVSSAASFFEKLLKGKVSYKLLVVIICVASTAIANLGLDKIVSIAAPILDIVYPPTLALVLLSWLGDRVGKLVCGLTAGGALVMSVLTTLSGYIQGLGFVNKLPLAELSLGWVVPTAVVCVVAVLIEKLIVKPNKA